MSMIRLPATVSIHKATETGTGSVPDTGIVLVAAQRLGAAQTSSLSVYSSWSVTAKTDQACVPR